MASRQKKLIFDLFWHDIQNMPFLRFKSIMSNYFGVDFISMLCDLRIRFFSVLLPRQLHCDQIWRNFATLAKSFMSLAILFKGVI